MNRNDRIDRNTRVLVRDGAQEILGHLGRRQRHDDIAELRRTKAEGAVAEIGIALRHAPGRLDLIGDRVRKLAKQGLIVCA